MDPQDKSPKPTKKDERDRDTSKESPREETAARMLEAEDLLLRGFTSRRVTKLLAEKYGLTERNVRERIVNRVKQVWAAEAAESGGREARRVELRERFDNAYRLAATRTKVVRKTRTVEGEDGLPRKVTSYVDVVDPDFKAMGRFGKLLMDLDGLGEKNLNVNAGGDLGSLLRDAMHRREKRDAHQKEQSDEREREEGAGDVG